jgi:phosphate transporter
MRLGHSPRLFILAVMFLGLFLSMWISNHTAPILCTTILTPIIQDLPQKCRFTKGLLLGLAFACNFGGMSTPISSLQNALAVGQLQAIGITVSFGRWLLVSLPFCTLGVLLSWAVLCILVRPDDVDTIPAVVYSHQGGGAAGKRNIAVISFCSVIVLLLATSQMWEPYVGDIGIISLCFLSLMFGSGILTEVECWHLE